jgi:translocator protein
MSLDRRGVISLVVFFVLVAAAAAFGAQFSPGDWYEGLQKPSWNPPNSVFGPVWTALYICIAIAGWHVWTRAAGAKLPVILWFVQLVLNALWSLLFFGMHRPEIAAVDIVLLLATIIAFIVTARRYSKLASALFIPYALWVAFATALNLAIVQLN